MRSVLLHLSVCLLLPTPLRAVDTIKVVHPDPVTEAWRWTEFNREDGVAGVIRDVYEDRDGNVWLATEHGVQRYDGSTWTTYTVEDGLVNNAAVRLLQSRDGSMWVTTSYGGICRFDPSAGSRSASSGQAGQAAWTTTRAEDAQMSLLYAPLCEARDGTMWAGFGRRRAGSKLLRFDGQAWVEVELPEGVGPAGVVKIYESSAHDLWVSVWGQGVLRLDPSAKVWTQFASEDALAGDVVNDILEAKDGSLWFATDGGLSRFDGRAWVRRVGGGTDSYVRSVWQASDGAIWVSGGGLRRWNDGKWRVYSDSDWRIPSRAKQFSNGRVWFYDTGRSSFLMFAPSDSTWTTYTDIPLRLTGEGRAPDNLFVIDDSVWIGGFQGAARLEGDSWTTYVADDGLIDGPVSSILKADDGALWFAGEHQARSGVARFDGSVWRIFTEKDGLVGPSIGPGLVAASGELWFATKWWAGWSFPWMRTTRMSFRQRRGSTFRCESGRS